MSNWSLQIELRGRNATDLVNIIGVHPEATDAFDYGMDSENPPEAPGQPSLYFANETPSGVESGRLAFDIRSPTSVTKRWVAVVEGGMEEQEVTLTWSNLISLPKQIRPLLSDLETGRAIYMRTFSSYTFWLSANRQRRMLVEVNTQATPRLAIHGIRTIRSPNGMTISFSVTAPAFLDAKIVSATGKPVRNLTTKVPIAAGNNSVNWDLRDEGGQKVPPGLYLIQMVASDEQQRLYHATHAVPVR